MMETSAGNVSTVRIDVFLVGPSHQVTCHQILHFFVQSRWTINVFPIDIHNRCAMAMIYADVRAQIAVQYLVLMLLASLSVAHACGGMILLYP